MSVYETQLPLQFLNRGKVRDIYRVDDDHLLLVATDRLSAFDVVFPDPIPSKGDVLNRISAWWFSQIGHITPNHLVTADASAMNLPGVEGPDMRNRCSLVKTSKPLPVECVVRGYLEGSSWKDYQATGCVSGIQLPAGLRQRERLPHPIFTPSTKAESGHDEPISFERVVELVGVETAEQVRMLSLQIYSFAHDLLAPRGILLSDTKFEFGIRDGKILLIDEVLTPDSSRFWEAETYYPGSTSARSYDKQFVRDYVEEIGWNKQPPAPHLPAAVMEGTTRRYIEIFELITGTPFHEETGTSK